MEKIKRNKIRLEKGAEVATRWIGSTASLVAHTILFIVAFTLPFLGMPFDRMLLGLTTIVSLEAIYLSIFIQMSVNKNTDDIEDIAEDVEEIEKDIDEIQEDIEDIEEDSTEDQQIEKKEAAAIESIQKILIKLQQEIEQLKK